MENGYFPEIGRPRTCARKCLRTNDCKYFVLMKEGEWKGCWLKSEETEIISAPNGNDKQIGVKCCNGKSLNNLLTFNKIDIIYKFEACRFINLNIFVLGTMKRGRCRRDDDSLTTIEEETDEEDTSEFGDVILD